MNASYPHHLKLLVAMIVTLGAFHGGALATDIHVSVAGKDTALGTATAPLRTIQRGASLAEPGDTVWVHEGVYFERVTLSGKTGTPDRPITIRSATGETVVIDQKGVRPTAETTSLLRLHNCSHVVIEGLELRGLQTATSGLTLIGIYLTGGGQGVRLVNNKIHAIWHLNPTVYNYDANAHGILVAGNSPTAISQLEIEGNELYDLKLGASEAMALNGNVDGFIVRNNVIHDANNIGIDFIGYERTNADPTLDIARNGICTQNTVYNIDSRFNPAYGGSFSGGSNDTRGAVGIYADGASNIVIERNHVYGCNIGIEVGCEHAGRVSTAIKVRNNLIRHNHVGGIFLGGYESNVGGVSACSISHNTIYQNDLVGYGGGQIALQYHVSGTTIQHNIIVANRATRQLVQLPNGTGSYAANCIDWNLYSGATSGNGVFMWHGRELNGLGGWRAAAGQDGHSFFADNPGFTDVVSLDFTLGEKSVAIDSGDPTFFYDVGEADYFGRVRTSNGRTDLGMAERDSVKAEGPTVETGEPSSIDYSIATLNGTIVPGPTGATVWFEYGTSAIYGKKTAVQVLPASDEPVTVTSDLTGLTHKTTYHFRIVGNNATGSNGGYNKRFLTPPMPPPVIMSDPLPQLAAVGEGVSFTSAATGGLPMTTQWTVNKTAIHGATAGTYVIPKLTLRHAARYAAVIKNASATTSSSSAVLAVVDPINNQTIVNEAATLVLKARAAAPAGTVLFQWLKDGLPLMDDIRIKGSRTAALVVHAAISTDAGEYCCQINLAGLQRNTGVTSVAYRPRPVMNPYVGETGTIVSGVVTGQISAVNELINYSAVGLPSGIVLNTKTGAITGRPNAAGTFKVSFFAHNLAGASKPLIVAYEIAPLPVASVGNLIGIVERSSLMKQANLGGMVRLSITPAGITTGRLTFGAAMYSFVQRLDAELGQAPQLKVTIKRVGSPSLLFVMAFDSALGATAGSISTPTEPQAGAIVFRMVWQGLATRNLIAAGLAGRFTVLMEPGGIGVDDLAYPQGSGYLSAVLTKAGVATIVGRLADANVVSLSTIVGMTNECPLHQLMPVALGSMSGWARVDPLTGEVTGEPTWSHNTPVRPSGRVYASGFPQHTLNLAGGLWMRPVMGAGILGLASTPGEIAAQFHVLGAAGSEDYRQSVQVTNKFLTPTPKDILLNPNEVTLTLNSVTGLFSGRFVATDGVTKRPAAFQGAMLMKQGRAGGYFLMPDLPAPTVRSALLSCLVKLGVAAN